MKLKIVQSGFETYTGLLGDVTFTNGVSDRDLNAAEIANLTTLFAAELVADEEAVTEPQGE